MLTLVGFTSVFSVDDLSNTLLSQGYILEDDSHYGNNGHNLYSKDRGAGGGDSDCSGPACRSTRGHVHLMTSFNRKVAAISNVQRKKEEFGG